MSPNKPVQRLALVGNPNCGKTALFNRLTGARQKVANYAGVTVERKEGRFTNGDQAYILLDLPGTYSLNALTPDEAITRDLLLGKQADEPLPDIIILVVDATNLRLHLHLVLEVKQLQRPIILALNMMDVAQRRDMQIDLLRLQSLLQIPVVPVVATRAGGEDQLLVQLAQLSAQLSTEATDKATDVKADIEVIKPLPLSVDAIQQQVRQILATVILRAGRAQVRGDQLDRVLLHPLMGYPILMLVLFLVFQAVFSWSAWPMDAVQFLVNAVGQWLQSLLPEGVLRSLLVDGIVAGVGSVLIFLPQILILFFFILVLEDSGYLPRAAFLLDRLMGSVGLSGRAFIPLLSSFACAIPGIMATRTIQNPRDRLTTIMIAPLMTCSARLPVYALIIGAFIPAQTIGWFNLQGLVLFGLYIAGIVAAMAVAYVLKLRVGNNQYQALMMELPNYHWPNMRNLLLGLWERARIFLGRVGGIILALMILLWFLSSFPAPPENALGPAIQYSFAGQIGQMLQWVFAPIGFNWQISIALIPGMAAREVAVGALGTVYALSATDEQLVTALTPMIAGTWSLPTALALLAWFVFAPQCLATLSVVRRETNSWRAVVMMTMYLFGLAYIAAGLTYHVSRWLLA
jgi:ferrous iron transport protein B